MCKPIVVLSILIVLSFIPYSNNEETIIFNRIEYIYNLKRLVDKQIWDGFADKKFDLPLVYYTDSVCYVANPTTQFIASFKPSLVFRNSALTIYKTNLLDSVPFHMETGITLGDTSSEYNYKSPFMNCSSFEITQQVVHDVNSIEQWATMVIHEYFHGFQFKHLEFLGHFQKHIAAVCEDSLKKIYNSHRWFKENVDKENEILLTALKATNDEEMKRLLNSFFLVREQRRLQPRQQLHFDLKPIEQAYETMEGTARFAEFSLYNTFSKKRPDTKLVKSDSSYHSYQYFRNYSIAKDKWLYLSEKTTYFYATGFNMMRLLDKLKVGYQKSLFTKGDLSLEQMVRQHVMEKNGR